MKRSDALLTVRAETPAYGGFSIGRSKGKVFLIKGAIPGETVAVKIEGERKDYSLATVSEILIPSPDRVEPRCPVFGVCGGCQYQYLSYEGQHRLKEAVLKDCLRRIARIETDLSKSLLAPIPWKYRHRGQFKFSRGKTGFYREKTREIVPIEECPLMADSVNEYLRKATESLGEAGPDFLNDAEIHITCGDSALALIRPSAQDERIVDWDKVSSLFLNRGFDGLSVSTVKGGILRYGKDYTAFELDGLTYTVSPVCFFQSHWRLNEAVVKFLVQALRPLAGKRVVDLYAGAGNFSLSLALEAEEVIAVEENPYAIEDGKRNVSINNIGNCRFVRSPAESVTIRGSVDILILDPPRLGLTNRVIDRIGAMKPEGIVYISCNPTTLARDLRKLLARCDIESVRMIDFFPQTYHIESLVFLRSK